MPITGPLVLTAVGLWIGTRVDKQHIADSENQSKATILREMMTSRNGPDIAFFTAVGEQLTVHLRRYEKFCQEAQANQLAGKDLKKYLDEKALFDEKAIYFFYAMFRVAIVDFLATKGYVLYPRIWMEEAFEHLRDDVVEAFSGIRMRMPDSDLGASVQEQAALYRYFGASKATYHTSSERSSESVPDLFEFSFILEETGPLPQSKGDKDPYYAQHTLELRNGFKRFQERLRNKAIDPQTIILTFEAISGLDDYAFNTLFSGWYRQFRSEPPVNLSKLLRKPPKEFLPYPLRSFQVRNPVRGKQEWGAERRKAWQLILANVPTALKENIGRRKKAPASP